MHRFIVFNVALLIALSEHLPAQESITPTGDVLPNTKKLELTKPLHEVMVHGISQFAEQELQAARGKRTAPWLSAEDVEAAKKAARRRLREMIGAVDPLLKNDVLWYGDAEKQTVFSASEGSKLLHSGLLRWAVSEGVSGVATSYHHFNAEFFENLSEQELADLPPQPFVILLDDPELNGRSPSLQHLPERIAIQGAEVLCPLLLSRDTLFSKHPDIRTTNLSHREYIYRLGFNLGRHIIGYEVQKTLSFAQLVRDEFHLEEEQPPQIILIGVGEGALIAQFAAALEPNLFDAVVIHGYFGPRENVWQEPIYRNVWNQLSEFGDAELASLISPTPLIIEAGQAPQITGPAKAKPGQAAIAAPGRIVSPKVSEVQREFKRADRYASQEKLKSRLHLVENATQVCGKDTVTILNRILRRDLTILPDEKIKAEVTKKISEEFLQAQQKRLVSELVRHTQMLLARSDKVRAKLWKDVDRSSVEAWEKQAPKYREMVHSSFIGKLENVVSSWPDSALSRKVIDEPTHVGYEIVLPMEVFVPSKEVDEFGAPLNIPNKNEPWTENKPGLIAGGILLLPKDLKEGEQRPVVVCQHGLEGVPMDTITLDESQRAFRAYKGFATQLVKRGFIVYAPQNPYKGYDDFRVIQRKSNPLGRSLFSYIIPQHREALNWLAALPYVDSKRIAFYGLSYGGKTAVRVPPLLVNESKSIELLSDQNSTTRNIEHHTPGYCLSICSADFNEWIRKNASAEDRYSYIYTPEYEIFEWNMGHIANYAELSWLMAPRPFMVERGHDDGVAPDEWVGWEYAKVRRHYTKLGIKDKTEIEWFDGPHTINGDGTFKFLHKHLNWPERK
ncbi:hypothetical protein N9153_00980 [Planctomicrobium sp.]|jgi:pimeloyl-ACP methyl ester carboxylesterase|nr:hypothetical protein [Planctomicrobium sp.]MDB4439475.1 hypothetical protein [Planctomicrobium sp.]